MTQEGFKRKLSAILSADGIAGLGGILTWSGKPEETIGLVKKAMRLNPMYQTEYLWNLGHAYFYFHLH